MTRTNTLPFKATRFVMTLAVVLAVSACSSKNKDSDQMVFDGQDAGMGQTDEYGNPLDQVYDGSNVSDNAGGSSAPGTQADLVVNVGDRVFFGTDRYDLSSDARSVLDAQAAWLKQYPNVNVSIEGHADERGTREYNLALGERRANSVRNYLTALGVSSSRIQTISFGKERPAVPGASDSAWSQNRRGVTKVN